ncbi:unnamed protein product [Coffea canephora]|uniref:Protein NRT1/ PTR FAMILY 5.5-like n=1 Tax=Coffea canephora TaxID=49390 RepID=A0A068UAJ6_COFCA|nr:unnamed protein product [Coffea canephora]
MAFLRIMVLLWADMLATYVMWIMQKYLTDVWKLGVTHAAGIMNVYTGLSKFLPLVFFIFVDAGLSNYRSLLLSSIAFSIGMGFLSMSTPPVLHKVTGTCKDYEPNCLGHTQKALFYTALALIAAGLSGRVVSLVAFAENQIEKDPDEPKENEPTCKSSSMSLDRKGPDGKLINRPSLRLPSFKAKKPSLRLPSFMVKNQETEQQQQTESTKKAEVDLSQLQFQPLEAMLALAQKDSGKLPGACCILLVPVVGLIALPYIKPWSIRFGIPAICTLVATLAFVQGTCSCNKEENRPAEGSTVTNVFRVFVASTRKMLEHPKPHSELYEKQDTDTPKLPHTKGLLSFLDKAAIRLKTEIEEPKKYRWSLCTRTEVEETKIIIRMIPIWITFVICGVITSVGNTYFVEQASHMNYKIGKLKLPDSVILVFYGISKLQIKSMYDAIGKFSRKKYAPSIGIAFATIFSVLCCITAAGIETRRIHVIRSHGLLDKPDDKIPLSALVLLPQYFFLAGLDSFFENSVTPFLTDQSPPSMKKHLVYLSPGLSGLGTVGSVLSVYVVGKISERRGKPNWFQYTLNQSRLDRYYWVLAVLSAANFLWFVFWAVLFPLREPGSNDKKEAGNEGVQEEAAGFVTDLLTANFTQSDKA